MSGAGTGSAGGPDATGGPGVVGPEERSAGTGATARPGDAVGPGEEGPAAEEVADLTEGGPTLPARLDELDAAFAASWAMPISGALVGNRAELLALAEEIRAAVPEELFRARDILAEAQETAERARAEAEALVTEAQARADALVADHAILAEARTRAAAIVAEAHATAADLLAELEVVLGRMVVRVRSDRTGHEAGE